MHEKIFALAKELNILYELSYNQLKPNIDWIIKSKITDIDTIERQLEGLLNIPTDKAYRLLRDLCNYYAKINKENAQFYLDTYDEMYGTKKKTKKRL